MELNIKRLPSQLVEINEAPFGRAILVIDMPNVCAECPLFKTGIDYNTQEPICYCGLTKETIWEHERLESCLLKSTNEI